MARFLLGRDQDFFQSISREIVDDVIDTLVKIYKIAVYESRTNIYGESLDKLYQPPIEIPSVIERSDTEQRYEGFLPDTNQTVQFRFNRFTLEDAGVWLDVGDIIYHNDAYFEISNVREDQLIGGRTDAKFSIVADTFMSRISTLQIEERIV
jgi:PAS domain-containing protein